MNPSEYVKNAISTEPQDYAPIIKRLQDVQTVRVLHAAMGMVTEAGELMDALKRCIFYGKPLDMVNIKEEGGDSFWYHALLADVCGFTFEDCWDVNIAKLRKRFPDRFSESSALNRDLTSERQTLEQAAGEILLARDEFMAWVRTMLPTSPPFPASGSVARLNAEKIVLQARAISAAIGDISVDEAKNAIREYIHSLNAINGSGPEDASADTLRPREE